MKDFEVPNSARLLQAIDVRLVEANTLLINLTCFDKEEARGAKCWQVVYKLGEAQKMFAKLKALYDPTRQGDAPLQSDSEPPRAD